METMLPPDPATEHFRPLKRAEYHALGAQGFFADERVELLFGAVYEMTPIDPAHQESCYLVRRRIERGVGDRAVVREQNPFAASEISEPQPDVMVVPATTYWTQHPSHAHLIVEVARSSLPRDRGLKVQLYGLARVDEYWIINHVDHVVEVYRDVHEGTWQSRVLYRRGETIAMLAFPDVTIAVADVLPPR